MVEQSKLDDKALDIAKNVISANNNIAEPSLSGEDKFCTSCGTKNVGAAKFCCGCGRKI